MGFFNQFSFVLAGLIATLVLGFILLRWRRPSRGLRAGFFGLFVIGVVAFGFLWRYPSNDITTAEELDEKLQDGQPTFVMLYSNY
jgi:drug/metabolite transporter (DMT)-like permease